MRVLSRVSIVIFAILAASPMPECRAQVPVGWRMPMPPRVQMTRWSATSSGPAALGSVLSAYGKRLSPQQLERLCDASAKRASLESLDKAASSLRFKTRIATIDASTLPSQPLPAIAEWQDGEFRVFIDTRGTQVEVFDPATGARIWIDFGLLRGWTGRLLLVNPVSI